MSDYIASMKKGLSQVDAGIKKGFSQVIRTTGSSEVLDPLSMFASQAQNEKEENDANTSHYKDRRSSSDHSETKNYSRSAKLGDESLPKQRPSQEAITKSDENDDDKLVRYLTGEQKIMSLVDASIQTTPGHFMTGTLLMTNYRISFVPKQNELRDICATNPSVHSWLQIPLASIDRLEREKKPKGEYSGTGINITIYCKDFRHLRITVKNRSSASANGDYDIERAISVLTAYAFPNNMRYLFAFSHSLSSGGQLVQPLPQYDALLEFSRMGVLDSHQWRLSTANSDFKLCGTYAKVLAVPRAVTDEDLHIVANFRSGHRLPALCWADKVSGTSMWRSSQPKAGVSGSCMQDEKMLDQLAKSCLQSAAMDNKKYGHNREPLLHVVDLRSRASAMANRAAGAGYESQANYPSSRLEFYNIPNIHGVRDSLKALAAVTLNPSANAAGDITFSKQVEDSQWLTNLRLVIKASWETARFISRGQPVLVHCSHGWDRTAQVCALSQLLLDPHYRTLDGFKTLVEKEWVSFGHPFQMRCGHSQDKSVRQEDQVSPIMLQFLDCVWQVQRQHCQYFEFNARYLLAIADHIYSGRFGTFLFSNDYDREMFNSRQQCADIWTYLHCNRACFVNPLYMHSASTSGLVASLPISSPTAAKFALLLPPLTQMLRNVTLWSDYFLRWSSVPSVLYAPTVISKQLYYNGSCRPLFFPESDCAYEGGGASLPPLQPTATPGKAAVSATGAGSGDLDVLSAVTSEDFWEGAYRLERETRIRAQEVGVQLRSSQAAMVARLKNFLFEKALDLNEDELNAVLMLDGESAGGVPSGAVQSGSSTSLSAAGMDENLGEFSDQIRAADVAADDLLQERGLFDDEDPPVSSSCGPYDGCDDDSLLLEADAEGGSSDRLAPADGRYSPLPPRPTVAVATPKEPVAATKSSSEQSFFV